MNITSKLDRLDLDNQISRLLDGEILSENEVKMVCEKVTFYL